MRPTRSSNCQATAMKPPLRMGMCCATVLSCCLLAACSGVRLQSLSQATHELSGSVHRDARQECQKTINTADYMACIGRADKTYEQFRQEQQKQKPPPIVIQRPASIPPDLTPPP